MKPKLRPIEKTVLGAESVSFHCAGNREYVVTKDDVSQIKVIAARKQPHVADSRDGFVVYLRPVAHQRISEWAVKS